MSGLFHWLHAILIRQPKCKSIFGTVPYWETQRKKGGRRRKRILLALADFSFVVVLGRQARYVVFITAYHIEREHQRRKHERQWKDWLEARKG